MQKRRGRACRQTTKSAWTQTALRRCVIPFAVTLGAPQGTGRPVASARSKVQQTMLRSLTVLMPIYCTLAGHSRLSQRAERPPSQHTDCAAGRCVRARTCTETLPPSTVSYSLRAWYKCPLHTSWHTVYMWVCMTRRISYTSPSCTRNSVLWYAQVRQVASPLRMPCPSSSGTD